MVDEPIQYLPQLSSAGFKKFLAHIERMSDQAEFVAKGEELGSVGLCLDLTTSINKISVPLIDLDQILLMCVPAGKSGQTFDENILSKIRDLKEKDFENIEVDGGINNHTLPLARSAGANLFCVTSYIFSKNPKEQFRLLEKKL